MNWQRAAARHLDGGNRYIPIAGTHGWGDAWVVDNDAPLTVFLESKGFRPIRAQDGRPFRWSTDVTGLSPFKDEHDWMAGADALSYFLQGVEFKDRNLIAHSHGGQVAAFCAASGVPIRSLTTIGTPVRTDVPWKQAWPYIGRHVHVYDNASDWWGWLGSIGDMHVSDDRWFKVSYVQNVALKDISHSKILQDAKQFHWWLDASLLDLMASAPETL